MQREREKRVTLTFFLFPFCPSGHGQHAGHVNNVCGIFVYKHIVLTVHSHCLCVKRCLLHGGLFSILFQFLG